MTKTKKEIPENYRPIISSDIIPSPSKNTELTEKKQAQIVKAACNLFFKKGFHGTSIREIADESGMSMGQLYHYISSKDDILFLVAKHMQELFYERLVEVGLEKIQDPLAKFIKALRLSIEFPNRHKKLIQFIFTEAKYLGKKHLDIILKMDDINLSGFFQKLLEEVNEKYPVNCNLGQAAKYIIYITAFNALKGWSVKQWPLENNVDFQIRFILKGLGLPFDESF